MIIPQPTNHTDRAHARLSASGAHRWAHCAASVKMEADYPDQSTAFAREGTAAHELADRCLREELTADYFTGTGIKVEEDTFTVDNTMAEYVQMYLDYVRNIGGELYPEQRVDFSRIVPGGFGTSDAIIFKDGTLYVIDLKYGQGVRVEAENNDQALLYAIGAMNEYGCIYDNIDKVKMVIVQPRLDHISEWEIPAADLKQHEQRFKEAAAAALSDNAAFTPGEKSCRFCKAKADCKALAERNLALAVEGFEQIEPTLPTNNPDKLTKAELTHILDNTDNLKNWISAVEARAQAILENGEELPGYKLVEGRSLRKWDNEKEVIAALKTAGIAPTDYLETKLTSPAKLEKIIGKSHDVIKTHVIKPQGKPTLAKASDKRPALIIDPTDGFQATA